MCSENSNDVTDAANAYRECLDATLQFLANASFTVSNFLSIYQEGCQVFLNHDFDFQYEFQFIFQQFSSFINIYRIIIFSIIRVYEKLLIPMAQEIYILFQDCHQTQTSSLINLIRLELMKTFEFCLCTTLNNMRYV